MKAGERECVCVCARARVRACMRVFRAYNMYITVRRRMKLIFTEPVRTVNITGQSD